MELGKLVGWFRGWLVEWVLELLVWLLGGFSCALPRVSPRASQEWRSLEKKEQSLVLRQARKRSSEAAEPTYHNDKLVKDLVDRPL